MSNTNLKVGDIAISTNGRSPFEITYIGSRRTNGVYLHNGNPCSMDTKNVIPYEGSKQQISSGNGTNNITINMAVRCNTDDGTTIDGVVVGIKQSGDIIVEKSNGVIVTFSKELVSEITNYTARLVNLITGKSEHMIFKENSIKVGDIVVFRGAVNLIPYIAIVDAINTRDKKTSITFTGEIVVTQPLI